jgi:hypothetical protein
MWLMITKRCSPRLLLRMLVYILWLTPILETARAQQTGAMHLTLPQAITDSEHKKQIARSDYFPHI